MVSMMGLVGQCRSAIVSAECDSNVFAAPRRVVGAVLRRGEILEPGMCRRSQRIRRPSPATNALNRSLATINATQNETMNASNPVIKGSLSAGSQHCSCCGLDSVISVAVLAILGTTLLRID